MAKALAKALEIDLDGLMARSVAMPIPPADIGNFDLRDDKVFYLTGPSQMIEGPLPARNRSCMCMTSKSARTTRWWRI